MLLNFFQNMLNFLFSNRPNVTFFGGNVTFLDEICLFLAIFGLKWVFFGLFSFKMGSIAGYMLDLGGPKLI